MRGYIYLLRLLPFRLPYARLANVTKSVTKWQIFLTLRDDVLLKKIQLMGRIDALCKFDFLRPKFSLKSIKDRYNCLWKIL
jgi:hypothetical protein